MKRKLKYKNGLLPLGAGDDLLMPLGGDLGLLPLGGDLGLLPLGAGDDLLMPLGEGDDLLRPIGELDDLLRPIGELDDLLRPADPDPAEPHDPPVGRRKLPEFWERDRYEPSSAKSEICIEKAHGIETKSTNDTKAP
jgi:hypothetical protein